MPLRTHRREFLRRSAALAGAGLFVAATDLVARSPNDKLNIAIVGAGGRGGGNIDGVQGENIVALCDVDDNHLNEASGKFPSAQKFHDFRRMLDELGKSIDAVVVSTPDHTHAVATIAALKLGKHVYCEKPLTHSIGEARAVAEAARKAGVATQMGNQGHSGEPTRQIYELIRAGAIGPVREVYGWTDRPIWPQDVQRPTDTPDVPASLKWDLWLGPAPERPYNPAYHPFKWRGWWDFGTGAVGDMACHVLDAACFALDLKAPDSVVAEAEGGNAETAPKAATVTYKFPARGEMPPVTLTWSEGGRRPSRDIVFGEELPENGTIYVGDKGVLYAPDAYSGNFRLLPTDKFGDFKAPEPYLRRSPGHHEEWIAACKSGSPTGSNFEYAAALTEMVLIGNLAMRLGQPIEWDAAAMKVKGRPEADPLIMREYRKGWSI